MTHVCSRMNHLTHTRFAHDSDIQYSDAPVSVYVYVSRLVVHSLETAEETYHEKDGRTTVDDVLVFSNVLKRWVF